MKKRKEKKNPSSIWKQYKHRNFKCGKYGHESTDPKHSENKEGNKNGKGEKRIWKKAN